MKSTGYVEKKKKNWFDKSPISSSEIVCESLALVHAGTFIASDMYSSSGYSLYAFDGRMLPSLNDAESVKKDMNGDEGKVNTINMNKTKEKSSEK